MKRTPFDAVLVALAVVNLAAGVALSYLKGGFSDLLAVAAWSRQWIDGLDPYGPHSATDYPPWALVELSPLAAIGTSLLPPFWIIVNVVLAVYVARTLAARGAERPLAARRLMWLMIATACLRTLAQFSHLSWAFALAGVFSPTAGIGGLLVGLSLMKPQVGGAALLCLAIARDWRRAAWALLVPVIFSAVFVVRLAIDPLELMRRYAEILASIQASPETLPGHSDLRAWLWLFSPDPQAGRWLTVGLWAVLVAPGVWLMCIRRSFTRDESLELLAWCGATSLLAVRHLSYDFVLLLPALVAWRCPPFANRAHAPPLLFWTLAALMVMAVPSWARAAIGLGAPETLAALTALDRVMCLGVWLALTWRLTRRAPPARTAVP